jgi:hypothetical protein
MVRCGSDGSRPCQVEFCQRVTLAGARTLADLAGATYPDATKWPSHWASANPGLPMTDLTLRAWAYLSRVVEPPCAELAELVDRVGPVAAAERVPGVLAGRAPARRADCTPRRALGQPCMSRSRGGRGSPPASPGYGRNFRSRCVFIVFPVPQCPRAAADSAPAPPAQRGSRSGWQSPHPQTPVACAGWLAPVVLSARDRAGEWAGEMPR